MVVGRGDEPIGPDVAEIVAPTILTRDYDPSVRPTKPESKAFYDWPPGDAAYEAGLSGNITQSSHSWAQLAGACRSGNMEFVQLALTHCGSSNMSRPIEACALGGHPEILKVIWERSDKNVKDLDWAMRCAGWGGSIGVVEFMLQHGATNYDGCMFGASENGYVDIVNIMLQRGSIDFDSALFAACRGGRMRIAKMFVGRCDQGELNFAFAGACTGKQPELMKLMADHGAISCLCGKPVEKHYIVLPKTPSI